MKEYILVLGFVMLLVGFIKLAWFSPTNPNKVQVGQMQLWKLGDEAPYNFVLRNSDTEDIWHYHKETGEWLKQK